MRLGLCQSRSDRLRKRQSILNAGILAILIAIILLGSSRSEARTVRIGVYDNPPKVKMGSDNVPRGIFVDIIEHIAERETWETQYIYGSWQEGLQRLKDGNIDLMPDVAFSAAREEHFSFHKLAVQHSWLQVFSATGTDIQTFSDLQGKTIAVLEGGIQQAVCDEIRENLGLQFNVVTQPDYQGTIQQVKSGQADAILAGRFYEFHRGEEGPLIPTPMVFNPSALFFATSKGNNLDLLNAIDMHLAKMIDDPQSVYYQSLTYWLDKRPEMFLPQFVLWSVASIAGILFFVFIWSLALRRQVTRRTEDLIKNNAILQKTLQELKLAQDEAIKNERLYAFGLLANGTAHDFNNLLFPIKGYAELILSDPEVLEDKETVRQSVEAINSAAAHGTEIVRRMQRFVRSTENPEPKSWIDTNAIIREVAEIGNRRLQSGKSPIKLVLNLGSDCEITGRKSSLHEMLLNLFLNATDAMQEGGLLEISTRNTDGTVRLTIKDDGIGMTKEVIDKCREPFFTSKGDKGTGMGLTMVNNIVAEHDGHLEIESTVGSGARFTMTFPRGRDT